MSIDNHITRWAAVVPVLADAGCPFPYRLDPNEPYLLDSLLCTIADTEEAIIAVLEQWFAQTVVPWWKAKGRMGDIVPSDLIPPEYCSIDKSWRWYVDGGLQWNPNPTEAFIQCAEALAKTINGDK
jgi:hypothetical protein